MVMQTEHVISNPGLPILIPSAKLPLSIYSRSIE
jgi:hypothetical protein